MTPSWERRVSDPEVTNGIGAGPVFGPRGGTLPTPREREAAMRRDVDIRAGGPQAGGQGLSEPDFQRVAVNGFGDPANSYVHCMAEFRGSVYAGTSRHSMALLKLFPPPEPPLMDPWPVPVPDSVEQLDVHGQIWRLRPDSDEWEKSYTSPDIIGKHGRDVPRDLGYRGMTVFQGESDEQPALYVGAISTVLRGKAAHLLRSEDGESFQVVGEPGLGNPNVSALRAMTGFDGHLYVPPAGEGITLNSNRASVIMRSADPVKGPWVPACEPGFGESGNNGVFELAVFADHLYAGTFNADSGYQVWKSPATGGGPCYWRKVLDSGAFRGPHNEIAMSMAVFGGALYIGSAVQNGGYDRVNKVGPAASELVRLHADDSWDLVVGEPRQTPDGWKEPLAELGPGFDNPLAGYFWRMAVHDGWLYLSTFDWTIFLPFARRPSALAEWLIQHFGADALARRAAGFELWRSADGMTWFPVTRNGFRNPYNYGGRTLLSTSRGLFVGTANPFGPEVPVRFVTGWDYMPNPQGGAEVWIGRRATPQQKSVAAPRSHGMETGRRSSSPRRRGPRRSLLLTGATGFVGSHLLPQLLPRFEQVRILALPDTAHELADSSVEVLAGDLTDPETLRDAAAGITTVMHLAAALPGAPDEAMHRVNVLGTKNLLYACQAASTLQRFFLLSSTAVYSETFEPEAWPLTETAALGPAGPRFLRPYGWSKVAAERLVSRAAADSGYKCTILRPAICYGLGAPLVEDVVKKALDGFPEPLNAAPQQARQWVHISDLVDLILLLAEQRDGDGVYHLAGPDALSLSMMARVVRHAVDPGHPLSDRHLVSALSDRIQYPYDLTKLNRELGYQPRISLREGLTEWAGALAAIRTTRSASVRTVHEPPEREPLRLGPYPDQLVGLPARAGREGGW